MATAEDLIRAALVKINVIDPTESATAGEMTDGLAELNRMLDAWSAHRHMIYARNEITKALTANDGTYTIGTSGDINTARPERIESAFVRTSANEDFTVDVLMSQTAYNKIVTKSLAGIPSRLFYDTSHPLGIINLYPVPDSATTYTLYLYAWQPFTQLASLTTSVSYPSGYEDAIVGKLAMRLSINYGKPISSALELFAGEAISAIRSNNVVTRPVDIGLTAFNRGSGTFDITEG